MRKVTTLVLIVEESRALLGMKKRGFGVGKWNGFGGKVEPNETVNDAAIREIQEEAGITPLDMKQIGLMAFDFPDLSCVPLLVGLYLFLILTQLLLTRTYFSFCFCVLLSLSSSSLSSALSGSCIQSQDLQRYNYRK